MGGSLGKQTVRMPTLLVPPHAESSSRSCFNLHAEFWSLFGDFPLVLEHLRDGGHWIAIRGTEDMCRALLGDFYYRGCHHRASFRVKFELESAKPFGNPVWYESYLCWVGAILFPLGPPWQQATSSAICSPTSSGSPATHLPSLLAKLTMNQRLFFLSFVTWEGGVAGSRPPPGHKRNLRLGPLVKYCIPACSQKPPSKKKRKTFGAIFNKTQRNNDELQQMEKKFHASKSKLPLTNAYSPFLCQESDHVHKEYKCCISVHGAPRIESADSRDPQKFVTNNHK